MKVCLVFDVEIDKEVSSEEVKDAMRSVWRNGVLLPVSKEKDWAIVVNEISVEILEKE